MNGGLSSDTLKAKVDESTQTVSIEPDYLDFLREHGYIIDSLNEAHTVQRGRNKAAHLVLNIQTYNLPKDHPDLDVAVDGIDLWVCDCGDFTYRKAADVSEGQNPSESQPCTHIRKVSKVEQAKADDSQATIDSHK